MKIIDSQFTSPHLELLQQWFCSEWGEDDFFITSRLKHPIPAPLIALEGNILAGGLAFTRYHHPDKTNIALWVNAVLVDPAQRGKSIASKLVDETANTVTRLGEKQIFALTDIPSLYKKSGWAVHSQKDNEFIMCLNVA